MALNFNALFNGSHRFAESIQTQLRKGVLELCVLTLLSRADSYGYEIATRLMQEVGMGEGTIYPLMRRMQDDGQVQHLFDGGAGRSAAQNITA